MENMNISKDKFRFADPSRRTGDKKFDTKQMSYARDVFVRFCKNKSSVVAAVIILLLVVFAIVVPIFNNNYYTTTAVTKDKITQEFQYLRPKCEWFVGTGFWDGGKDNSVNQHTYNQYRAHEVETGRQVIMELNRDGYIQEGSENTTLYYDVRIDTYAYLGIMSVGVTAEKFEEMKAWQDATGIQLIYPAVNYTAKDANGNFLIAERIQKSTSRAPVWYATDSSGNPKVVDGEFINVYATTDAWTSVLYTDPAYYNYDSKRVEGDDGSYIYAEVSTATFNGVETVSYNLRVDKYAYFQFLYGFEPSFLFGTNEKGHDILTRLANGARFSLVLAVCISAVNLFIGAIYGAIEGFYGGIADLAMERFSDILGGMPSMVVMSLFQLHLASKVGPVWSMVFAFILTGWLGMAARTRMQFYRFKRQEYVLSARTLGASDGRLMFKHIFPNAMGTLITGSVLSIPGVIFSESSLTYLGIVNLESSETTSVGTLLSNASGALTSNPHLILFPALFISLLEISFNLFGNGLRDAFNPSLKGIED